MKLNLFFVLMYVLTLLAYPIVFVYSKLLLFSKSIENITLTNMVVKSSSHPSDDPLKIMNIRKKGKYAYPRD